MLTHLLSKAPEWYIVRLIKVLRLSEDGIAEYLHDLFCPCTVELDMEVGDAAA